MLRHGDESLVETLDDERMNRMGYAFSCPSSGIPKVGECICLDTFLLLDDALDDAGGVASTPRLVLPQRRCGGVPRTARKSAVSPDTFTLKLPLLEGVFVSHPLYHKCCGGADAARQPRHGIFEVRVVCHTIDIADPVVTVHKPVISNSSG